MAVSWTLAALQSKLMIVIQSNIKNTGESMPDKRVYSLLTVVVVLVQPLQPSYAHGFAGKRFFPATLSIDDPYVADEGDFMVDHIKGPDEDGIQTGTTAYSFEYSKRLTSRFGLSVGGAYLHLNPDGAASANGFDNFEFGAKYLLHVDPESETLMSAGVDLDAGGTGSRHVGAESFSQLTPTFFFGKGLGNLPESMRFLRPVAITGAVGVGFPTRGSEPRSVQWGFTLQYNLQYLQSFVKDVGMGTPFDRMIPIVEIPMQTCLDKGCGGDTTGTVNPGMLWFSHWGQVAVEAQIPVNKRTGSHAGFLVQVHFYLDDIFPQTLGKPIMN